MKMPTLEQFRTNRNVLFWSLHAAGWAAYGITQYFGALLYEKPCSYARGIAVAAVSGFRLSMPMRFIYRRLWGRPPRLMITGALVTCYITALALRIVINLSYKQFVEPDWHAQTLFELFGGALSTTYLLLCSSNSVCACQSGTHRRCSSCSAAPCPRPTCCCAGACCTSASSSTSRSASRNRRCSRQWLWRRR